MRLVWVVSLLARHDGSCGCDRGRIHGSPVTATLHNPKDDDDQGQDAENCSPGIVGLFLARSFANAVVSVRADIACAAVVHSLFKTHRGALLEGRRVVGDGLDGLGRSAEEVGPDGFMSNCHAGENG